MTFTRLEFFEAGYGLAAVRLGIMSTSLLVKYDMYKTYCAQLEKLFYLPDNKASARAKQLTMAIYQVDYWAINRAVNFFEEGRVLQISVNGHAK